MLHSIRQALAQGCEDEAWYDEQLTILLARMRAHQEQLLDRVDRLALIRAATRREVYRRVARATDLLHSNYANGVDLTALAQTANMSKYHFLRLFKLVHGLTPHTYLQRKRIGVAVRLLESTSLTVREVAVNVGFADDSTLVRQMRRWMRRTPGQVRAGAVGSCGWRNLCTPEPLLLRPLQQLVQVQPRLAPITAHRPLRSRAHGGDLREREAAEELQVHQLGQRRSTVASSSSASLSGCSSLRPPPGRVRPWAGQ